MTKNRPIQIMIVMAVISIIGIIAVQIFWVSQAINEEEEAFDHNVRMALRSVADQMCQIDGNELITNKPIDRVSRGYFIARLRYHIDVSQLEGLITAQFERRGIDQDYEYAVYDCDTDQMVFGSEVVAGRNTTDLTIPDLAEDEYYFGVYFPNKTSGLLSGLNVWKFMTVATLLMVVFFSYGLVVVLRQRRLSEIQRDFIDNVTHELKTPLSTLRLAAEAINGNDDRAKHEEYAKIILSETQRLEGQVEHILSTSIAGSKSHLTMVSVEMNEFLNKMIVEFEKEHPSIGWKVQVDQLPRISTNENSLEIILRNLVDNAIKYGNGSVLLKAKCENDMLCVSVEDNGEGISKQHLKYIFRKFYRVPTHDVHDVKGYGLGLYIVKQYADALSAKLRVRSGPDGTTMSILLKAQ